MNAERELETSPVPSSMSSKLAGVLVIGCIVAGIAISGRHRPSPHTDDAAIVEPVEAPIELSEQSDYFRRLERPRSPASTAQRPETAFAENSSALASDPLAEASTTNLPRLESKYSATEARADRRPIAPTERIADPSSDVRLVSGTTPARPRFRVRVAEPTAIENIEKADDAAPPPLRPSRPVAPQSSREDQSRRLTHHTIRDGDTLESIAEIRLGSARRWRELYDLNRDTLSDPESLPVGTKLRLSREPRKIAAVDQGDANDLEPIGAWEN